MQISCPSCAIAYQVPEAKMAGKRLRCSSCGHVWTPFPRETAPAFTPSPPPPPAINLQPAPSEAPVPAAYPPPPTPLAKSSQPQPIKSAARRSLPWVLIGWAATILVWGFAVLAIIDDRTQIARIWPPSTRLYRALGMEAQNPGPAHDPQDRRSDGPAGKHQY